MPASITVKMDDQNGDDKCKTLYSDINVIGRNGDGSAYAQVTSGAQSTDTQCPAISLDGSILPSE